MKYLIAIVIFFLFGSYMPTDRGDTKKEELLIKLVLEGLDRNHYEKLILDDEFSKKVFDLYIKRLDYYKRYLIQEDIDKLKKFQYAIDDIIKSNNFEFFSTSVEIITKRFEEADIYTQDILDQTFDLTVNETFELDAKKIDYAADKKALKERWRKYLKYETLTRLHNIEKMQNKAIEDAVGKDTVIDIKPFDSLLLRAKKKVIKSQRNRFNRLKKLERSDWLSAYINSFINTSDPHTVYMPPRDKENFDIAMSGQLEGIGAQLQEKDGYIKVTSIVPGSASSRQGELKAGDIILKVAQGNEEPVDVTDVRIDHAVKLIRGKKGTEVRLTTRKIDGTVKVIAIIRDVVILEDTYAKSAVIEYNGTNKRYGYISLPKFYADFNKKNGRSCAKDVRKIVEDLNTENISGIIMDLRNNSGGSLYDVVEIAGLFIAEGPIVQIKTRYGAPHVLRDKDPTIQYNGPLVILVNSFSASASEIMAAAMQDYQRGIIIGSKATFGKGTVQRMFNLDTFVPSDLQEIKPMGAVKITMQKFYRIDGSATQLKGVTPDIILPDSYRYIDIGEKEQEYCMPWDEITPVSFNVWNKNWDDKKIKKKSDNRVQENQTMKLITQNAERLKRNRDKTEYALNYEEFKKRKQRTSEESKKFENIQKLIEDMDVFNLNVNQARFDSDSSYRAKTETYHESIKKDAYIYEALEVLSDVAL
ncbi:MAG: carboxy terminal-processing peptidase [Bacteroidetes bacterium]|nr:carboxy terminal-processing peptidase [Bacteroidota bacterium]